MRECDPESPERKKLVVDVGAGTGKFAQTLLSRSASSAPLHIVGVEPVAEMRAKFNGSMESGRAAVGAAAPVTTWEALDGTADRLPVADGAADVVVAAQAFHWFSNASALREFARVLRPAGKLVLIWNKKEAVSSMEKELEAVMDGANEKGAPAYKTMAWQRAFKDESNTWFDLALAGVFPNPLRVSPEGLVDRAASVSYVSASPRRDEILSKFREIIRRHNPEGKEIEVPYETDVWIAELRKLP